MRKLALAFVALALVVTDIGSAKAYCRRTTPLWSSSIRVVIHPQMQDYIRHPFINPATGGAVDDFACTTSAQCGPDGLCVGGFPGPTPMRCRGQRWTRSELERAVLWVVGRINNETPADIPFVYVDLNDTNTCVIDEECDDGPRPWLDCIQTDTIVILPSECDPTAVQSFNWSGVQWIEAGGGVTRNALLRIGWSGNPGGISWEHTGAQTASSLPEALLHEMGHALGLGHTVNDYPSIAGTCVPLIAPGTYPNPMCPVTSVPPAGPPNDLVSSGTCPIMDGAAVGRGLGLNQHFFGLDDINGLVALYGLDTAQDTRLYEDCDLGTTPSFLELSTTDLPILTDMGAAPNLPLDAVNSVTLVGRTRNASYQSQFQIYNWDWYSMVSTPVALIDTPGFLSTGPIGVSASQYERAVSANPLRLSGDHRHWMRRVRTVRRSTVGVVTAGTFDPADPLALPYQPSSVADTPTPGVSTAYHAPTDSWLHLLRDYDGQVLLVAWRGTPGLPGTWSNVIPMGFRSFATPSIACSPNRCFIAFVEVPSPLAFGSNQTRLQWTEGTVAWPGSTLTFTYTAGITTSWYNVLSDPTASVAKNPAGGWYYYVSTSAPQFVAFGGGGTWGTRVLTYRRSEGVIGTSALTQITPLLSPIPGVSVQAAAGGTGVCAELFAASTP